MGAIKRYYSKAGKLEDSLKKSCFAKSCQKSCSGPVTRHLIHKSCGAKKPASENVNATLNDDDLKGCWKTQMFFFRITSKRRF